MAAPETVVVRALGVAVGIPAADAETASRLRHLWARAIVDEPAEVMLTEPVPSDDYPLSIQVTLRALEATAGHRLNLHAGAVADDAGHALAVIGSSGSGKTTAVRILGQQLGYLSDETVSLSDDLTVHPHPKPLSVISDPGDRGRKESIAPGDAGLRTPPAVASLRALVLLRRGHGTEGLIAVSTPEAMVEIVPQTSSLTLMTDPLAQLARTIESCGGALALHYDEIADHVADLTALLAEEPPPPEPFDHHPSLDLPAPVSGEWSRVPWLDAVQCGDELVVMVGDTAHLLAGIGTTVWLTLAVPATVEALVVVAVAEHGDHPEARALVESALVEMAGRGLVTAQVASDA